MPKFFRTRRFLERRLSIAAGFTRPHNYFGSYSGSYLGSYFGSTTGLDHSFCNTP
jgi:hypothetical protein